MKGFEQALAVKQVKYDNYDFSFEKMLLVDMHVLIRVLHQVESLGVLSVSHSLKKGQGAGQKRGSFDA